MNRVMAMAAKEAKQFLRDRLTVTVSLALPLVLMALYGSALTMNVGNLRLVVADEDSSALSRRYIEAYAATNKFVLVSEEGKDPEELLASFQARAVLRIPPGFDRDWRRGLSPQAQLVVDGTDSNAAVILRGIAAAVSRTFQPRPSVEAPPLPPVRLAVRYWHNPGLSDGLFFGSGALGLVLILFPALLGAISVSRELELGTVVQAYASSLSSAEWVVGKAVPYLVVGLLQAAMCFGFGMLVFGYSLPEHPGPVALACFLYVAAGILYGMMVGGVTGTQSAAIQGVQFGAFLLSLLMSGFLVPIANMPEALQWLSNIVPARHFIEATRDAMLRGGGWQTTARPIGILAGLAMFFLAVNVRRMRKMQLGN